MKSKFTLLVLSTSGAPVKQFTFSLLGIFLIVSFVSAITAVIGYAIYDYHQIKMSTPKVAELQKNIATQSDEIKHQNKQIKKFAEEVNILKSRIISLNEFEKKIRVLANLENSDDQGLFGIGGSFPEDLDTSLALSQKHNSLVREMHEQVEQIHQASALQEKGFDDLLTYLNSQRNILASTPAVRPTKGIVTSQFGYRMSPFTDLKEFHKGVDIANRAGTEILAPANGKIIFADEKGFWGNLVIIDHGHGIVTHYAHLSKFLKNKGDLVKRGDIIGLMGSTGRSTGPHLHYEVYINGGAVNPEKYILN